MKDLWKNWEIRVRSREFGEERMREASKEKRLFLGFMINWAKIIGSKIVGLGFAD